ncbi:MAG TPA: hypothetical protein DEB39_17045 [Planctomycetaceae bacterium]|nr:hypothetical protein [Planctomycetaceae bacterium]
MKSFTRPTKPEVAKKRLSPHAAFDPTFDPLAELRRIREILAEERERDAEAGKDSAFSPRPLFEGESTPHGTHSHGASSHGTAPGDTAGIRRTDEKTSIHAPVKTLPSLFGEITERTAPFGGPLGMSFESLRAAITDIGNEEKSDERESFSTGKTPSLDSPSLDSHFPETPFFADITAMMKRDANTARSFALKNSELRNSALKNSSLKKTKITRNGGIPRFLSWCADPGRVHPKCAGQNSVGQNSVGLGQLSSLRSAIRKFGARLGPSERLLRVDPSHSRHHPTNRKHPQREPHLRSGPDTTGTAGFPSSTRMDRSFSRANRIVVVLNWCGWFSLLLGGVLLAHSVIRPDASFWTPGIRFACSGGAMIVIRKIGLFLCAGEKRQSRDSRRRGENGR